MAPYKKHYKLDSRAWAASGNTTLPMQSLPGGRLTHIVLEVTATVTNSTAGDYTAYPRQLARLIAKLAVDTPTWEVKATGRTLWNGYRHRQGKSLSNGGSTISTMSTGTVRAFLHLSPVDWRAASPLDCAQPTELLEGKSIEVEWSSSGTLDTDVAASAITVRPVMFLDPSAGVVIPSRVVEGYEDWTGAAVLLPATGNYTHLHVYDESDDVVTTTEYASMRVTADGNDVVPDLSSTQLLGEFNHHSVMASSQDNETDQLPGASVLFMPVLTPKPGYKLTSTVYTAGQLKVEITGTATTSRFAFRIVQERTQSQEVTALSLLGLEDPKASVGYVKSVGNKKIDPKASVKGAKLARSLPYRAFGKMKTTAPAA